MIIATNLSKKYNLGDVQVEAVKGIDLTIPKGQFLVLRGASGSGKSTLLNLLGCIEKPDRGSVTIEGLETSALSRQALARLRARRMGFIFQTFNLLPVLNAYENIELPLLLIGTGPEDRSRRVTRLLQDVGLDRFADHRPAQLSGGQRQRVAIARAMAASPSVLLADEPTANLDHHTGQEILALLKTVNKESSVTLVIATHDEHMAREAHRTVELSDGLVVKDERCI